MFWFKSGIPRIIEGAAWMLDAAVGFGLISGAAVAVAFGKFLLGGALAFLAVGVFLRFKRRRQVPQEK